MERYLTKQRRSQLSGEVSPVWVILPLISIFVLNCLIYWEASTDSRQISFWFYHVTGQGSAVNTTVYLDLYSGISFLGCELYSGCTEKRWILSSGNWSDCSYYMFYYFSGLPTTNVRPEIAGTTWTQMLKFVYLMDGGNSPSNLFPSIHCYVAGWAGAESVNQRIFKWYQHFSLTFCNTDHYFYPVSNT